MKTIVLVFTGMTSAFLAESCQGYQMTECMMKGETEDLVKEVIFGCFAFFYMSRQPPPCI
jgi:hypothetical protein